MNREDTIRTLRESCDKDKQDAWQNGFWVITQEELERFAALVVASIDPSSFMSYQEGYEVGVTVEREACAKVCEEGIANADDWNSAHWDQACENRAWAIRARDKHDN
ncbi:MAG: hypothetical protein ACKO0Z_10350 [Betaproteobacteria bacterium]